MKQRPRIYYTESQKALMWDHCVTDFPKQRSPRWWSGQVRVDASHAYPCICPLPLAATTCSGCGWFSHSNGGRLLSAWRRPSFQALASER